MQLYIVHILFFNICLVDLKQFLTQYIKGEVLWFSAALLHNRHFIYWHTFLFIFFGINLCSMQCYLKTSTYQVDCFYFATFDVCLLFYCLELPFCVSMTSHWFRHFWSRQTTTFQSTDFSYIVRSWISLHFLTPLSHLYKYDFF